MLNVFMLSETFFAASSIRSDAPLAFVISRVSSPARVFAASSADVCSITLSVIFAYFPSKLSTILSCSFRSASCSLICAATSDCRLYAEIYASGDADTSPDVTCRSRSDSARNDFNAVSACFADSFAASSCALIPLCSPLLFFKSVSSLSILAVSLSSSRCAFFASTSACTTIFPSAIFSPPYFEMPHAARISFSASV